MEGAKVGDSAPSHKCRRGSRILVRGASRVLTPTGTLSPKFAQNRCFSLKIACKLHDFEEILGARGAGPPGSATAMTGFQNQIPLICKQRTNGIVGLLLKLSTGKLELFVGWPLFFLLSFPGVAMDWSIAGPQ